ncbi:MAG TPA: hypothetical protein VGO84_08460 [Burkholderiales bacterium]|nr:hypothetical protein [Burkholderiales bacterium]
MALLPVMAARSRLEGNRHARDQSRLCHPQHAGGANAAVPAAGKAEVLFKAGVLQAPILNCGNFSIIATDERGLKCCQS